MTITPSKLIEKQKVAEKLKNKDFNFKPGIYHEFEGGVEALLVPIFNSNKRGE